ILHAVTRPSYWPYVQWGNPERRFGVLGAEIASWIKHTEPLRVCNQFGKRSHLHLLHHLVAMRLHGALGCSQFMGDLLVDLAADDQIENLSFPGRQGRYKPAKGIEFVPLMVRGLIARHGALDRVDQDD